MTAPVHELTVQRRQRIAHQSTLVRDPRHGWRSEEDPNAPLLGLPWLWVLDHYDAAGQIMRCQMGTANTVWQAIETGARHGALAARVVA